MVKSGSWTMLAVRRGGEKADTAVTPASPVGHLDSTTTAKWKLPAVQYSSKTLKHGGSTSHLPCSHLFYVGFIHCL